MYVDNTFFALTVVTLVNDLLLVMIIMEVLSDRMGSDIGKSRAERIREIWPIRAHDVCLWVRMRRQIARTRADFPQFSEMSDNRETG